MALTPPLCWVPLNTHPRVQIPVSAPPAPPTLSPAPAHLSCLAHSSAIFRTHRLWAPPHPTLPAPLPRRCRCHLVPFRPELEQPSRTGPSRGCVLPGAGGGAPWAPWSFATIGSVPPSPADWPQKPSSSPSWPRPSHDVTGAPVKSLVLGPPTRGLGLCLLYSLLWPELHRQNLFTERTGRWAHHLLLTGPHSFPQPEWIDLTSLSQSPKFKSGRL